MSFEMGRIKTEVGYKEALALVREYVPSEAAEKINVVDSLGRTLLENAVSAVDSPPTDIALKDGYALVSEDAAQARPDNEICLRLVGFQAAGDFPGQALASGHAVRITRGAPVPAGATAVLAQEFTRQTVDEAVSYTHLTLPTN